MSEIFDVFFHVYQPKLGDVVVEVGAGTGHETKYLSDWVGDGGLVVAVEPNPVEFETLEKVCAGRTNIRFVKCVALDYIGIAMLSCQGQRSFVHEHETSVKVQSLTLDSICSDLPQVDFLKMNIEGSEVKALQGFTEGLQRTKNVMVSCHDFISFPTKDAVRELLTRAGFEVTHWEEAVGDWARDYLYGTRV